MDATAVESAQQPEPLPSLHVADAVGGFAASLGLEAEAVAFLHDLPDDMLTYIVNNFDPSGTKDGNVLGRLQGFTRHMLRRSGQHSPASLPAATAKDQQGSHVDDRGRVEPATALEATSAIVDAFAIKVGLNDAALSFLRRLQPDVQQIVAMEFDPTGTKDGNVWGRLLAYVRSIWQRRLNVDQETLAYIRSLPEEVQMVVIAEFDPTGSKDGNVAARLQKFISRVSFSGVGSAQAAVGATPVAPPVPAPQPVAGTSRGGAPCSGGGGSGAGGAVARPVVMHHTTQRPIGSSGAGGMVTEFAQRLGLDEPTTFFMQSIPEEVQSIVISKFDPSGTKDGHVAGRLLGYVRQVWGRQVGADRAYLDQLRSLPEEDQMQAMVQWNTAHHEPAGTSHGWTKGGHGSALAVHGKSDVQKFVEYWSLDSNAENFLYAIPAPIREIVLNSFDGSGTKDGNLWGRLLGFTRIVWAKFIGLDQSTSNYIRTLPNEVQVAVLTMFDPSGSKDGNVAGRLEGFLKKVIKQYEMQYGPLSGPEASTAHAGASHAMCPQADGGAWYGAAKGGGSGYRRDANVGGTWQSKPPGITDPSVTAFMERCGFDSSGAEYLESLPADVLAIVVRQFDPSGTKDGNVLGRLQGYVRALVRKRSGNSDPASGQNKQSRIWA